MTNPICPQCGGRMRERKNRASGSKFFGCAKYPGCKGTRPFSDTTAVKAKARDWSDFKASKYQDAIGRFLTAETDNLVVEAGPGSGKTTLLEWLVSQLRPGASVALLAFNKKIATELKNRIAKQGVYISTLHSLGYANIRQSLGKIDVDEWKYNNILRQFYKSGDYSVEEKDTLSTDKAAIVDLVSKRMATLSDDYPMLIDRFNIDFEGEFETIAKFTNLLHDAILTQDRVIGYDEMIYFSAIGKVPCRKFDSLFVDETQDMNQAQIEMLKRSLTPTGRIVAVGDRWQSIYSYRGADTRAIDNIVEAFGASTLPLSISYRMPKSHVRRLNNLFPWAPIEPAAGAKEGTIKVLEIKQFENSVKDGDLVLCRCNAPLVNHAFKLLRQGIKVVILGRDIGKGLSSLIDRVCKKQGCGMNPKIEIFYNALQSYVHKEVQKLIAQNKEYRAAFFKDKIETIYTLADNVADVDALHANIDRIFSNTQRGVTFSTVHKAKGFEAERVFILNADKLGSHPKATREWERQQERNIAYVAFSRSKSEMYLINKEKDE